MPPRIVEIRQRLLKKNDQVAARLRERFYASGVFVVNLVSSPGSGKTEWLAMTLGELLARGHAAAAVVGDVETDRDAVRLATSGAPVRQINTHGRCHLEAATIAEHLEGWQLDEFDFLFIENIGNLVCTSTYDLGESLRVAMLSVPEGEDKPLKYPALFHSADLALLSKTDLADACEFLRDAALENLRSVNPAIGVLEVSARSRAGLDAWLETLQRARNQAFSGVVPTGPTARP